MPDPVDFSHPANQDILDYLKSHWPDSDPSRSPDDVDRYELGVHPDSVEYFWDTITQKLPDRCAWVVYGRPVLVHPASGVIFGIVRGSYTTALRLPEADRQAAFQVERYGRQYDFPTTTIYASETGEDWALVNTFDARTVGWCRSAYDYAASLE